MLFCLDVVDTFGVAATNFIVISVYTAVNADSGVAVVLLMLLICSL